MAQSSAVATPPPDAPPAPPRAADARVRRAIWTYAAMALFTAVTMLTGLVATPLLVRWLGDVRMGASRMILEYFGYLALLELGLGGALAPLLARALGRGDRAALRATMAAGLRLYLGVAALTVAVGLLVAPVVGRLVAVPPALLPDLRAAWLVGLGSFALLALSPFRALTEAGQRGYEVNLLMTAQALAVTASALLLARSGWGLTGQSAALLLGAAIVSGSVAALALRRHPSVAGAFRERPDPEALRQLRHLSGPALVVNISGRVSLLTDSIVVGSILGPAAVTVLFVTQRLPVLVQGQLQGIGNACWAPLAELHARGDLARFNAQVVALTRLVAILAAAALGPIVAYDRHFVALWMGDLARFGGDLIAPLACANAYLLALVSLWGWCLSGTGRLRDLAPLCAASAALNLALSVAGAKLVGVAGPLLGTSVALAGLNLWATPLLLRRAFGTPARGLAAAALGPLALALPFAAALVWLTRAHRPAGWIGLIVEMGGAALLYLALADRFLLDPAERARWHRALAGALPRRLRPVRSGA